MICTCGHTSRQHELRSGGLLGCFIHGCNCIDLVEAESPPPPSGRELSFKEQTVYDGWRRDVESGTHPRRAWQDARFAAQACEELLGQSASLSSDFWVWLKIQAGIDPEQSCCPICGGITPPREHQHCLSQLGEWPAKGTRYNDDVD